MNTFLFVRTREPGRFDTETLLRTEEACPTHGHVTRTYASADRHAHAVFYEVPTRLFPEGAAWAADTDGVTFFDGYVWPVADRTNRLPEMGQRVRDALCARSLDDFHHEYTGQFAVLHYEEAAGRVRAFVDPGGVCPLYFHIDGDSFCISNRVTAIQQLYGGLDALDMDALSYFATWGMLPPSRTIYQNIGEFGPGCTVGAEGDAVTVERNPRPFHDVPGVDASRPVDDSAWEEVADELAANLRFIHHCPDIYPVFGLSGGKDSRLLLSVALREGVAHKIFYFTQGVPEHPDVIVAREIAEHFGLPHEMRPPVGGDVDSMRILREAIPIHMFYSEGMHTAFEPHARPICGGDPLLTGMAGEVYRDIFHRHGHDTRGVDTVDSAKSFLDKHVRFNEAGICRPELVARHQAARHAWVDEQVNLGVAPADLPSLYHTWYQSLRRNTGMRKINGYWYTAINALHGNRALWITFQLSPEERRIERVHFEVMRHCSAWISEHHFANDAWDPKVFPRQRPPRGVTADLAASQAITRTDWRTHVDSVEEFKGYVRDYMLSTPSGSGFWDIIDRAALEKYFDSGPHAHMSRYHLFGALTIAHILQRDKRPTRMKRVPAPPPVFVRQVGERKVYIARQGVLSAVDSAEEFKALGGRWEAVKDFEPESFRRFDRAAK